MPKKFLRTKELHKLNTFFERNSFECIFLYGRRRLGKTYLISEFIKDKDDVFFFTCVKSNEINFEVFANELKVVSQIPYNSSSFVN
jgi:AAA+ ATPase superfamily predicted ATPase